MSGNIEPKLTSGELAHVWELYMSDSAAAVVFEHFLLTVQGDDARSICAFALQTAQQRVADYTGLIKQENYPMPEGFSSKRDLNPNAQKIVTDEFMLYYIHQMTKVDLALSSMAYSDSVRSDLRKRHKNRLDSAEELYDNCTSLLLEKGLYIRSPLITSTHESEPTVESGGFLSNFFSVGIKRPLTAIEANELHKNLLSNHFGRAFLMALHQTDSNQDVKKFLLRGKELASQIMNDCSDVLIENDLPVAMTWDSHVLDSKTCPFSDRLIMFLLNQMNKIGLANYGFGAAVSQRQDIKTLYGKIIALVYQYQKEIMDYMIDKQWLEKPPVALDRSELARV